MLGVAVTIISERVIGGSLGSTGVPILSYGVILPVIQLVVMPIPALLLRVLPQFRDTIDGLVFGVTAGIGFALAEGVVSYWGIFSYPPTQSNSSVWIYPITSLALLVPVLHGSTAGAITATLWRSTRTGSGRWVSLFGIPIVLVAVIAFYAGGQILGNHGVDQLIVLLYQASIDPPRHPVHPPSRPSLSDGGGAGPGAAPDRVPALPSPRDRGRLLSQLWYRPWRFATSRYGCRPGGACTGSGAGKPVDGCHLRPLRHRQPGRQHDLHVVRDAAWPGAGGHGGNGF